MKQSKIKFNDNDSYNMNCDIDELVKLGFKNSTYRHDQATSLSLLKKGLLERVAPSYTNKKGNIQIFFFDLDDEGIKAEGITNKYAVQRCNAEGEYIDVGVANEFNDMLKLVKKAQRRIYNEVAYKNRKERLIRTCRYYPFEKANLKKHRRTEKQESKKESDK